MVPAAILIEPFLGLPYTAATPQNEQNDRAPEFRSVYTPPMAEPIRILTVELEDADGLLVTFSDGTIAGYVAEELLELRPFREPAKTPETRQP
jgi:hypothetical protein